LEHRRDDTIAALATPPGTGAIAIVRLSGPAARAIAHALTGAQPRARYADLRTFCDAGGERIDQGLLLYFPAPRSYTGEDVIELHSHGGRVVSDWLLQRVYALGARPAQPGEFTLRAFLNDKLDLLQAEAVADLIDSGSTLAARAASRSLDGEFSNEVAALQAALTRLRVEVEAWLDFPEEELALDAAAARFAERIDLLAAGVAALRRGARQGATLRDGLNVVIAGPPNAGKSSLLNRLAGYDAAIVTDIPGTTRDPLREHLSLDGLPLNIVDTAGLRESTDPVEREGLKRAAAARQRADRVLWVVDVREPLEAALAQARTALGIDTPFTLLRNKIDLTEQPAATSEAGNVTVIGLSALTGAGADLLRAHLHALAGFTPEVAGTFSARRRHLDALARAQDHLRAARAQLGGPLELAAEELRSAQTALSELTGEFSTEDLLGAIFASFCIGK
jgi:tRNA modification GTPase